MKSLQASQQAVCVDVCVHYSQHCFHLNPTVSGANTPNTLYDSIFVFGFMKKKIRNCLLFFFTTDWFSFPSSCLGPSCFRPACFFFVFFSCALHLAVLSDFLPSRLRRAAAAVAAAAAAVAVWLHGNSILHQCDRRCKQLERDHGRVEQGFGGGGSWRFR